MGQVCLQGQAPPVARPVHRCHLSLHTLDKVFPAFGSFSIPDKISKFGLVGHAVVSLPSPPPAGTCQCSYPARWPPHASCPVGSPVACDLPQTCVLPWRGSTSRNLEPWPCSGETSQILMPRGILSNSQCQGFSPKILVSRALRGLLSF